MFTESMVQMSHSTRTYILISVSDSLCSKREASWNFRWLCAIYYLRYSIICKRVLRQFEPSTDAQKNS